MKYADSSALLRILLDQPGPRMPLPSTERLVSADLLEVECARALERARLMGRHDDAQAAQKLNELRSMISRIHLVSQNPLILERATRPFGVIVRALDALHVATAEVTAARVPEEHLEFWTHDARQAIAARARGLDVRGV